MIVPPCRICPLIYLTSYSIGQRRAGSGTHLPPPRAQRSEINSRMCSTPPRKAKATMNCRKSVVFLVTVPVSCLDTAAVPGEPPPDPPPSSTGCLLSHSTCLVLGHSSLSRARTQQPCRGETPPGPPHRARPLVLGHRFCLVLGHSRRAGGGHPPPDPPLEHTPSCWDTYLFTSF